MCNMSAVSGDNYLIKVDTLEVDKIFLLWLTQAQRQY